MISHQSQILEKLIVGGAREPAHALAKRLNTLAKLGAELRQRYEDACSYRWANTPAFEAGTRALEKRIVALAHAGGLHCYLQDDCRGASVYVDVKPIPENAYNQTHCLTVENHAERKRRLAAAKVQISEEPEGLAAAQFVRAPMGGGWICPLNPDGVAACVEVFGDDPVNLAPLGGRAGYIVEPADVVDNVEALRNVGCGVNL